MQNSPSTPNTLAALFPPSPLQRPRRAQYIADSLRALILSGSLAIGSKLPTETVLCQQFCVSRTTLREAIQMLRSTGLLEVTPGRGSYVKAPSLSPLLPTLMIAAQGRGLKQSNPMALLGLLHQHGLQGWQGALRQREAVQALYQHQLPRHAAAAEATAAEVSWHLALLELSQQPLLSFLGQQLVALMQLQRQQLYHNPDELLRTSQVQLRVNAALLEGDTAGALRTLLPWCGLTTPAPTTRAA